MTFSDLRASYRRRLVPYTILVLAWLILMTFIFSIAGSKEQSNWVDSTCVLLAIILSIPFLVACKEHQKYLCTCPSCGGDLSKIVKSWRIGHREPAGCPYCLGRFDKKTPPEAQL